MRRKQDAAPSARRDGNTESLLFRRLPEDRGSGNRPSLGLKSEIHAFHGSIRRLEEASSVRS